MSRFDFLQADFPELYKRCYDAEQASDVSVIMLKCRQALELIVHLLGAKENSLFEDISELETRGILNANLSRIFHKVRRVANASVHANEDISSAQAKACLDQLLEITIWFIAQQEKQYDLSSFAPQDVALARKYMNMPSASSDSVQRQDNDREVSIDPLGLQDEFDFADEEPQDVLAKDVFETQEEYEQRIADMEPIHIGYGILDTRRQDGYTNIVFLIHHVDRNEKIEFASIDAFFVDDVKAEGIVDDELVARMKVYQGKVWCDYERVYLRHGEELIPLQVINWNKFGYETEAEYKKRIESLPLIPFGVAYPLRSKYDLQNKTLPFVVKAFRYTEKIMEKLQPENMPLLVLCNRDMAKQLCNSHKRAIMFGKISMPVKWLFYLLWEKSVGEVYKYDFAAIEAKKKEEAKRKELEECLQKEKVATTDAEKVRWLRKAVELGDIGAQNLLGDCYFLGKGVNLDYQKAMECYEAVIDQGKLQVSNNFVEACYQLGKAYYNGIGVQQDYQQAVKYYQKAVDQGGVAGLLFLGDCYYSGKGVERNFEKAVKLYRQASKQGDIKALERLGNCYYKGEGVEKDYQKAIECYTKAAIRGDAWAQYNLGVNYGKGIIRDYRKAVHYYQKAAEQGLAKAQNRLGNCYYFGAGIEKDTQKAIEWFQKAAAQGDSDAQKNIGDLYFSGNGVKKDYEKAIKWYQKSAEQGNASAQNALGNCYFRGYGGRIYNISATKR